MIERYSTKEIKEIWTDESKFKAFLEVELSVLNVLAKNKIIPTSDFSKIKSKLKINLKDIYSIEKETKHDVIAFVKSLTGQLKEEKRWIHYGLTSTDVVDTANALLLKRANSIIQKELEKFISVIKKQAIKYKNTPCIGRTHGIHAEPTSFGLKFLNWYDELNRNLKRFESSRKLIETGKISGAVGNHSLTSKKLEKEICSSLNLNTAKISTQVISRDYHIEYITSIAMIASTIEKIATEIRNLQRTEISEVQESFSKNQKGSSAMPHKKNPIISENMCGISRVLRSYVNVAFENNVLWHERDISHSSTERIILADATNLIHYMLSRYSTVIENLVVNEKRMLSNIYITNGVIFSQRVLTKLIDNKMSRDTAYDIVQTISMKSFENNVSFKELLENDVNIKKTLSKKELDSCFDVKFYLKEVESIFKQVL